MEIDTLQVAINNLTAQVNYLSRRSGYVHNQHNTKPFVYNPNTNYKPSGPLPPKLSSDEKDYLYKYGGCYKCCKLGHLGPDCKTFPPTSRPARQFNNIEVTAAPASHQASSQAQSGKATSD
jgi:hypothetical protein